jgi:hypothetical protein
LVFGLFGILCLFHHIDIYLLSFLKPDFCFSISHPIAYAVNATNIRGDASRICGYNLQCLKDRQMIFKIQTDASGMALTYISIIVLVYLIGMVILLLHCVKQKHGQVIKENYLQGVP